MTLCDKVRDWLGINILIRQQTETVTRKMLASFELASRNRHEEMMVLLRRVESMLVIEAPKRKPVVDNGSVYSLEEAQQTALAEMLANPPKES